MFFSQKVIRLESGHAGALARRLAKELAERPFAILGINIDGKDTLRQSLGQKKVIWRCWIRKITAGHREGPRKGYQGTGGSDSKGAGGEGEGEQVTAAHPSNGRHAAGNPLTSRSKKSAISDCGSIR